MSDSKRITFYTKFYEQIEVLAKAARRSISAQAQILVDEALLDRGLVEVELPIDSVIAREENSKTLTPEAEFILKLANGEQPSVSEINKIAKTLKVHPSILQQLKKCDNGNSVSNPTKSC